MSNSDGASLLEVLIALTVISITLTAQQKSTISLMKTMNQRQLVFINRLASNRPVLSANNGECQSRSRNGIEHSICSTPSSNEKKLISYERKL